MTELFRPLLQRCISLDLEVDPSTAKIFAFAAVRDDDREPILAKRNNLKAALDRLELEAAGAEHLLGHNILRHDLPQLAAVRPKLASLSRSAIDTLWLNPLAFPRNPYHHLVKHYHDGRLQAGHVNNPELDARLVFQVLRNQLDALVKLNAEQPEAVTAYHFLTTGMENSGGCGVSAGSGGVPLQVGMRPRRRFPGCWQSGPVEGVSSRSWPDFQARDSVGRWPMPCRGFLWRVEIPSCRPGYGLSFASPP